MNNESGMKYGGCVRTPDYNFARSVLKFLSESDKRINNISFKEVKHTDEMMRSTISYYEISWE